ncbi:hypothetical protein QT381_10105 [Galbitalea sp. SE-J8]|uniref:hypothetical protein n=1 Tax=Galbitalea sp. SE-J8 TaxID=3054952 RepID=UPI00259CFC5C|nr:hypothetical protein [Galbitalea sp. SE-J8]MDM4763360.1 hypothetical protein [Galbitalea sp. SE-J8]
MVVRTDAASRRPGRRPWTTPDVRLWTGIAGLAVAVLLVFEFTVRMSMGPRPALDEPEALVDFISSTSTKSLVKTLTDTVMMGFLIVFHAGLKQLIVEASPRLSWIGDTLFGAGIAFVAVTLVGDSLEAGAALDTVGAIGEPIAIRALTDGYLMMFGPMTCVLISVMAASAGYGIHSSGALPRWAPRVAYVVAILNLAGMLTTFGGTSNEAWYSVGGWGAAAFATFPWLAWVIAVSVAVFLERRAELRAGAGAALLIPEA